MRIEEIITSHSPIVYLNRRADLRKIEGIINQKCDFIHHYESNFYEFDDLIYYYKDDTYYLTTSYLFNDLLGVEFCKAIELDTVEYEIARKNNSIGLASKNFKDIDQFEYFYLSDLDYKMKLGTDGFEHIHFLINQCTSRVNQDKLLKQIFKLLSIDIAMFQYDRHVLNLQFKRNRDTNFLELAPIYDFERCRDQVNLNYFSFFHILINLNFDTVHALGRMYPLFMDILDQVYSIDMLQLIEYIWQNLQFNRESYFYYNIVSYYEQKRVNQRQLLKKFYKRKYYKDSIK